MSIIMNHDEPAIRDDNMNDVSNLLAVAISG